MQSDQLVANLLPVVLSCSRGTDTCTNGTEVRLNASVSHDAESLNPIQFAIVLSDKLHASSSAIKEKSTRVSEDSIQTSIAVTSCKYGTSSVSNPVSHTEWRVLTKIVSHGLLAIHNKWIAVSCLQCWKMILSDNAVKWNVWSMPVGASAYSSSTIGHDPVSWVTRTDVVDVEWRGQLARQFDIVTFNSQYIVDHVSFGQLSCDSLWSGLVVGPGVGHLHLSE